MVDFEAEVPGEGVGAGLAAGLRAAARGQLRLANAAVEWVLARVRPPRER
jgi:predicted transcriptional regulator